MQFSLFAEKFTPDAGILQLMDDLSRALAGGGEVYMLGGGNPGYVPEIQQALRARMEQILATPGEFERMIGNYASQQGEQAFLGALAALFRDTYGWPVTEANLALTNGSQNAFFFLFNLFAGPYADGPARRILLPLVPEYIGYSDVVLAPRPFVAARPKIEYLDTPFFKYRVQFDALHIDASIGALCVSRPTNPTGNVLTDAEMQQLSALAKAGGIPFIIDNAYGLPFPGAIYTAAAPLWDEHIILCLSLSKLGLPAARTGIVVAAPEVIDKLSALNAISNLAPASMGTYLALEWVRSGEILRLGREVVQPFYRAKMEQAVAWLQAALEGVEFYLHQPEGAFFLWLWLPGLPGGSRALYERLKRRGVIVVPGEYFFPGLEDDPWAHKHECLRITYVQDAAVVEKGIRMIGEEVKKSLFDIIRINPQGT